jgi:hypothetical protein
MNNEGGMATGIVPPVPSMEDPEEDPEEADVRRLKGLLVPPAKVQEH